MNLLLLKAGILRHFVLSMSKKHFIQVFEHHKLKYDENSAFNKSHFEAMVQFNEKNSNKYFTIIHKGVLFNSYVGVIQVGGLTVEILPKADNNVNSNEKTWQSVLLNMLSVCRKIDIDKVSETNLKRRYNSLLDVYFEMYLNELEKLIKLGLIKKYRRIQENQYALKGKLVFSKNLQLNTTHKERFFCEHQVYDKDNLLHQILYCGLQIIKPVVSMYLQDRLNRVLQEFEFSSKVNVTSKHFDKLILGRKEAPYKKAVEIAKMLILNYSPNLNNGHDNMLTLLFDMNALWEEFIYRTLNRHKPEGVNVSFQNSCKFWEHKKIRPDIVVETYNERVIIDTKWKLVDNKNPSDDDLKQMFTYNLHWKASKSILLYPKINQEDSAFGTYWHNDNKCKLGFIGLIEGESMKKGVNIADEIFSKLS